MSTAHTKVTVRTVAVNNVVAVFMVKRKTKVVGAI